MLDSDSALVTGSGAAITKEVVSFCNGRFQDDFTLVVVAAK